LKLVEDKIHRGTIVVADNAGFSAGMMSNYLDYVRNSGKYESQFISFGWDGMEVSRRGLY
jgi:predicted O-methyltransferase YrrM